MAIRHWEPLREITSFFDALESGWSPKFSWDLALDVYEEGNSIIAEMNAAGIDPEKIDISIENGYLKIAGSREKTEEKKGKDYSSKEIQRGSFSRSVKLPSPVEENSASATYIDGVLRITLPKTAGKAKAKKIQVTPASS